MLLANRAYLLRSLRLLLQCRTLETTPNKYSNVETPNTSKYDIGLPTSNQVKLEMTSQHVITENDLIITDKCAHQLKSVAKHAQFLRIAVDGGGCSGFEYKFSLDDKMESGDLVFKKNDVKVVVDELSMQYLRGSTIDFKEELIKNAFAVTKNPLAEKGCSCGLPIYGRKPEIGDYRYQPDEDLPGQQTANTARVAVQNQYNSFMETFTPIQKAVDNTKTGLIGMAKYVQEEGTIIPKAVAITIGGMAGFLYGMKRGGVIRRTLYTGTGLGAMAAFCYPHETVDLGRSGYKYAVDQWIQFQQSPDPPLPKEALQDLADKTKDIDLYSTRSTNVG